jgi:hypothetical protein
MSFLVEQLSISLSFYYRVKKNIVVDVWTLLMMLIVNRHENRKKYMGFILFSEN